MSTATGQDIVIPNLPGMDGVHASAIVASFQSIKPAITAAFAKASASGNQNAIALAQIRAQVNQIAAALAALTAKVNNLPSGGGSGAFPVVATYSAGPTITTFPLAVYESSPGRVDAADNTDIATCAPVVGIATAAVPGGKCLVTTFGDVDSAGWAWTPDEQVFLDAGGALTQTQPSADSDFICPIGFAITATRIFVVIGTTIAVESTETESALTMIDGLLKLLPIAPGGTAFQIGGEAEIESTIIVSFNGGAPGGTGDCLIQGGDVNGNF